VQAGVMLQAFVAAQWYMSYGSATPQAGGLWMNASTVAVSTAWTGPDWTVSAKDAGQGLAVEVLSWRLIAPEFRGKPLIVDESGTDATVSELQIGAWSVRRGRRIDPPPSDDGSGGMMRMRRKLSMSPSQMAEWKIAIVGVCAPEDLDGSGRVDAADLSLILASWGMTGWRPEDINRDGVVDGKDSAMVLGAWTSEAVADAP
jgi:hypothetical protein